METTTTQAVQVGQNTRRAYLWIGIAAPFVGIGVYLVQVFALKMLTMPWYLPGFGTAGVALVGFALVRKRNVWRIAGLVLVGSLAFIQWFFVSGGFALPKYNGPVAAGIPFPAFAAKFSDGQDFTQDNFRKDKNTALIFFRGGW
jgi:hypothetical protein